MIMGKTAQEKSANIIADAQEHGWTGTVKTSEDATVVKLTRGVEFIEIRYDGNSCREMPVVGYDGQVRQVRNVAAALRVIAQDDIANASVFANRTEKKAAMRKAAPVRRAPGQKAKQDAGKLAELAQEADEDAVKAKLVGRKLIWTNRISGELEEDVVDPTRNRNGHFYVRQGQVSFVGNYGFRSVRLDQLVAVR